MPWGGLTERAFSSVPSREEQKLIQVSRNAAAGICAKLPNGKTFTITLTCPALAMGLHGFC